MSGVAEASSKYDLSLVIPCYNEALLCEVLAHTLIPVLRKLEQNRTVELLFIDDGSSDGTGAALRNSFQGFGHVRVITHDFNRGLGAALRTGFHHAQGEMIVTTDCDGSYPFDCIPEILQLLTNGVDIVTASPYHPRGNVEGVDKVRLLLSKSCSLLYRAIGFRLFTMTALFRAYRREVIKTVPFEADGFLAVTEILVRSIERGFIVAEYPTTLYGRTIGTSKARLFRIIYAHLRFLGIVLFARLRRAAGAG